MTETTLQWQLDEPDSEFIAPDSRQRGLLLVAVVASLLLHGAIILALLFGAGETTAPALLGAVRINLVATNPQQLPSPPQVIAESIEDSAPSPVEELREVITDEVIPAAAPAMPPESEVNSAIPDLPVPVPVTEIGQGAALITLPTLLSVQQALRAVDAETGARNWLYECNQLEEDSGVRKCAVRNDAEAAKRYQQVERNAAYEALNPVLERSRTERSLRTVYQNTSGVAAALSANAIPESLAGYLLDELEAGTSLYTNNGTDRNQHMRRMVDRSAAAKQAERVLADPWVQGRATELQQRKVQAN